VSPDGEQAAAAKLKLERPVAARDDWFEVVHSMRSRSGSSGPIERAVDKREMTPPKRTKDPNVIASGRCYQCGRERPDVAVYYSDPFCRTECCKSYCAGAPRKAYKPPKEKPAAELGSPGEGAPPPARLAARNRADDSEVPDARLARCESVEPRAYFFAADRASSPSA